MKKKEKKAQKNNPIARYMAEGETGWKAQTKKHKLQKHKKQKYRDNWEEHENGQD